MIPSPASVVLAMAPPVWLSQLVALLLAAAVAAYVTQRLRLPAVVGFLLVGVAIGPGGLGFVTDLAVIDAVAELGVLLLLFTIGIELSLARLAAMRRTVLVGGGLQVVLTVGVAAALLAGFGVAWPAAVFTGFLVALSSTAVVLKLLAARHDTASPLAETAVGILIFQDLAVVAMVLLVPTLAGTGDSMWSGAVALVKAVALVVIVLFVARRVMPRLLETVARTCSTEVFLLTILAVCLGTAWGTSLAGVSLSLGAFLAGLAVSESAFSQHALGEVLPLEVLFSAAFFVSVGLLLDVRILLDQPLLVLAAVAGVVVVKVAATAVSVLALGRGKPAEVLPLAAGAGLLLAQVGEFSFVLERTGAGVGLHPAGLGPQGSQVFIAATVVLMLLTPVLARSAWRLAARAPRAAGRPEPMAAEPGRVLLLGYGEIATQLARALAAGGRPFTVVTLSPEGARAAEAAGYAVLRGDYGKRHILQAAGIGEAALVVVADDAAPRARQAITVARSLNPDSRILARCAHPAEVSTLRDAGADDVVSDAGEAAAALLSRVLEDAGSAAPGADRDAPERTRYELTSEQRRSPACTHTGTARTVLTTARGCAECLALGDTWMHLRVCLTCGHVGCCDSSKNRHARRHWETESHPIIKSAEPGEDWAWCFADEAVL